MIKLPEAKVNVIITGFDTISPSIWVEFSKIPDSDILKEFNSLLNTPGFKVKFKETRIIIDPSLNYSVPKLVDSIADALKEHGLSVKKEIVGKKTESEKISKQKAREMIQELVVLISEQAENEEVRELVIPLLDILYPKKPTNL